MTTGLQTCRTHSNGFTSTKHRLFAIEELTTREYAVEPVVLSNSGL